MRVPPFVETLFYQFSTIRSVPFRAVVVVTAGTDGAERSCPPFTAHKSERTPPHIGRSGTSLLRYNAQVPRKGRAPSLCSNPWIYSSKWKMAVTFGRRQRIVLRLRKQRSNDLRPLPPATT